MDWSVQSEYWVLCLRRVFLTCTYIYMVMNKAEDKRPRAVSSELLHMEKFERLEELEVFQMRVKLCDLFRFAAYAGFLLTVC